MRYKRFCFFPVMIFFCFFVRHHLGEKKEKKIETEELANLQF